MLIILERPGTQGLSRRILTVFQRKRSSPRQGGSRGECGGYKIKFEKGGHVHRFEDNAITPSGNRRKISQLILSDLGLRYLGSDKVRRHEHIFEKNCHWATAISNDACRKGMHRDYAQFSVYDNPRNKDTSASRRESLRRPAATVRPEEYAQHEQDLFGRLIYTHHDCYANL